MNDQNLLSSLNRPRIDYSVVLGVLGAFIFFMGFAFLLPLGIDLIYKEHTWYDFLASAVIAFVLGGALWYFFRPTKEVRIREGFLIVSLTWLLLSVIGALPFLISGILPSFTDAVFETMSGLTTTGSTIFGGTTASGYHNPLISELPKSFLFWRSLSHWLGGMGIIVLSLAILPLLGVGGTQLLAAESPGPAPDKLTPRVQQTAKLLWGIYISVTFLEFVLLMLSPKMDWFEAINHAFATLATGGFSTHDASIAGFNSLYIEVVISAFMLFSGINFALYYYAVRGDIKSFFKNQEFRFYISVAVLAVGITTLSLWLQSDHHDFGQALRHGSFQSISILTSTGFATDDYAQWPMLAQYVIFLMLLIGGCVGSTSGGIKSYHWLIVLKTIGLQIKQALHPNAVIPIRVEGKVIDRKILFAVISFFAAYLIISILGAFGLSIFGVDILSAFSATLTSMGNIGPGFGMFGPIENFAALHIVGKWILILLMMVGRLEIFTVLILFSPSFWKD